MPSGRQQRQRQQQKALLHRLSPTPGAGITPPPLLQSQDGEAGARTGRWGLAPALGLSRQGQQLLWGPPAGPTTSLSLLRALTVAGQAGITPNPQETAQRLALLRPAVGAAPDTLRENSHTCLRLQGSQFRTALRCPQAGGPQRLERATHNGDGAAIGVWGLALEVPRPGEIHPTPGSPTPLSCLTLGVQSKRGGAEREPLNARPPMPPA